MKLRLTRPLLFFDLEATGLNIATDRIVEISYHKIFPNGTAEGKTIRVRPTVVTYQTGPMGKPILKEKTMHIPEESTAIHGITDADVQDCPTFCEIAEEIAAVFTDCDLAGYNSNHFDIPLLAEEFLRAGVMIDLKDRYTVDAFTIFTKFEQRNLAAAYRFYCGKELHNAHSAQADTMATYEVLVAQLDRYDLPDTVEQLSEATQGSIRYADFAGRIAYDKDGYEIFNFGQNKGKRLVDVFRREPGYYSWIIGGDFPAYTKQVCTRVYLSC